MWMRCLLRGFLWIDSRENLNRKPASTPKAMFFPCLFPCFSVHVPWTKADSPWYGWTPTLLKNRQAMRLEFPERKAAGLRRTSPWPVAGNRKNHNGNTQCVGIYKGWILFQDWFLVYDIIDHSLSHAMFFVGRKLDGIGWYCTLPGRKHPGIEWYTVDRAHFSTNIPIMAEIPFLQQWFAWEHAFSIPFR